MTPTWGTEVSIKKKENSKRERYGTHHQGPLDHLFMGFWVLGSKKKRQETQVLRFLFGSLDPRFSMPDHASPT